MSDGTKIEWTDATVNVINGCSLASPGCTHCYAMKQAHRFPVRQGLTKHTKGGMVWTGEVRFNESALLQVLRWKRPRRIFWNAHGDTFHESVPDEWIDRCFAVMALTPQHQHQVLTKRSARMREYLSKRCGHGSTPGHHIMHAMDGISRDRWPDLQWPLPNVWLGVSVEDQVRADERIPDLLATPAAVRFLSCEPLLSELNIRHALIGQSRLRWVIAGGESGPGARPMHPDWARSLRDQCADAGVPFFFKQWGEYAPGEIACDFLDSEKGAKGLSFFDGRWDGCWSEVDGHFDDQPDVYRIGKKRAGRTLDGIEHNGMPS